jgi:hypothetical protein
MVFPGGVNEYSTARGFAVVALLAINPEDSRLRRVLVRSAGRPPGDGGATPRVDKAFLVSENKIFGVHLPMKIGVIIFDPCIDSIVSRPMR